MGAIAAKMRAFVRARIQYYQDDRQAIAAANMLNLRVATGLTFAFLLGFLALSPWLLPGWTPSVWHIGFVPVSAGLCVLSLTLGKRGQAQPPVATALCVLYEATLYLGMVLIDAPGSPDAPATFLPLVIIAMPALFTLPLRCTYGLILLAAAGYVAAALICKKPMVARYDIFELAAAIFFSLAVSYMSDDLRMRAYKMRQIYQKQSTRDALLDVYNKKAFEENARRYIDAFNPHAACALAVVDLDDFKQVNDTCGHLFGDTVLQKLGTAMQAQMRPGDLVGRFGGDEFLLFAAGEVTEAGVRRHFERLCAELASMALPDSPPLTCSMGIVAAHGQQVDYDSLFVQADVALYQAKTEGKNTFRFADYRP